MRGAGVTLSFLRELFGWIDDTSPCCGFLPFSALQEVAPSSGATEESWTCSVGESDIGLKQRTCRAEFLLHQLLSNSGVNPWGKVSRTVVQIVHNMRTLGMEEDPLELAERLEANYSNLAAQVTQFKEKVEGRKGATISPSPARNRGEVPRVKLGGEGENNADRDDINASIVSADDSSTVSSTKRDTPSVLREVHRGDGSRRAGDESKLNVSFSDPLIVGASGGKKKEEKKEKEVAKKKEVEEVQEVEGGEEEVKEEKEISGQDDLKEEKEKKEENDQIKTIPPTEGLEPESEEEQDLHISQTIDPGSSMAPTDLVGERELASPRRLIVAMSRTEVEEAEEEVRTSFCSPYTPDAN